MFNYFDFFDLPVTFLPDAKLLKQRFFELSRKYHPDFFTKENDIEKSDALDKASMVNRGYKILSHQDETIKYVLQLKGLLTEDEKYNLPPDFLMEMMELNEQLDESKMNNNEDVYESVKKEISKKMDEIYKPVKSIIEEYNDSTTSTDELLLVKEYYFKKKYLTRILATIG